MPPVLKGSPGAAVASANNVANPTTLNPTLPAHAPKDTLLCATFCRSATPTVATPSGWIQLLNVAGANGRIALFGKIAASASESAPSVVWSGMTTGTTGTPAQAQCAVFTGLFDDIANLIDVIGAVENGAASTTVAASGAAITTLTDNALILCLGTRLDDAGTWSAPAGYALVGQALTTSGADMSFAWAYLASGAKGSRAPADFGLAGASSFASSGVIIAFKPYVPVTYFGNVSRSITFGKSVSGFSAPPFPTISVVDNFDGRDEQPPAAPWVGSYAVNGFRVSGNRLDNPSGVWDGIYWDAPPTVDQECFVTVAAKAVGSTAFRLHVRYDPVANNGYHLYYDAIGMASLLRRISGNDISLVNFPIPLSAGDGVGIQIRDNDIYAWLRTLQTTLDFRTATPQSQRGVGSVGTAEQQAQSFIASATGIGYVGALCYVAGAPTDDLILEIQTDDAGAPSGVVVGSNTIPCTSLTTTPVEYTVIAPLVAGTQYWIVARRTGAVSSSAYPGVDGVNGNVYPLGKCFYGKPGSWSEAGAEWRFVLNENKWRVVQQASNSEITTPGVTAIDCIGTAWRFDDWGSAPAAPAEPQTHYGATSLSAVFGSTINGRRETFGQIDRSVVFSAAIEGRRKTLGQLAFPITFTKEVAGQRKTFGQLLSPFLFSKDVRAQRKTFGQTALPINVAITTSGFRVGLTQYGIVALPVGFASTTNGKRKTFGQVSLSGIFSKDVRGQRKTFGQISLPIVFTKEAVGREWVYGQLSMQTLFGKEISGRRKTFSQLTLPISFTKDIRAQRKAFGQIARPINFLAFVNGQSFVGPKTYYGQLISPFVFNKQVTAYRKTFGQVTAPFIFGSASQGKRGTFGRLELPINVVINVETGRIGTHSQISLPIFVDFDIDGRAFRPGVILNLADMVYLGSEVAEAIYVGIERVWPIFNPTKIAGLKIWLDANQLGLVDGAMIDTWPSLADPTLVGTNFNIAPYRPTLRANALNDLPVARFVGGSGIRWSDTGIDLNYTLVYVARMWGTSRIGRIVTGTYPPANILFGYWSSFEDVGYAGYFFTPDQRKTASTNWHLYSGDAQSLIEVTHEDYKPRLFSDGVFLSGDHGQNEGWKGTFNLNGYAPTSGEETCDCEIAEVIFYDRKLLDVERQQVEGYLREKWGL